MSETILFSIIFEWPARDIWCATTVFPPAIFVVSDRCVQRKREFTLRNRILLLSGCGEAQFYRGRSARRQYRNGNTENVPEDPKSRRVRHLRHHARPVHERRQWWVTGRLRLFYVISWNRIDISVQEVFTYCNEYLSSIGYCVFYSFFFPLIFKLFLYFVLLLFSILTNADLCVQTSEWQETTI